MSRCSILSLPYIVSYGELLEATTILTQGVAPVLA